MNDQANAHVGALSEIDRMGQSALDAIYAEAAHTHPDQEWMKRTLRDVPPGDPARSAELLATIEARTGMDASALTQYALEEMRLGVERAQAVKTYVTSRRIMDQLGAL